MRTRLQRAVARFNRSTVEGYNHVTKAWEPAVGIGSLQVYDRFITERSFGQKKRILYCGEGNQFDSSKYQLIRVSGEDRVYMVESRNADVTEDSSYAHAYLLKTCSSVVTIKKLQSTSIRASGVGSDSSLVTLDEVWGDIERYSSANSREFHDVDYTIVTISLPKYAQVDSDCTLTVEGVDYDVTEVTDNLDLKLVRAQGLGT